MASIQELPNATYASPLAEATYAFIHENPLIETVVSTIRGLTYWQIILTLIMGALVYDQRTCFRFRTRVHLANTLQSNISYARVLSWDHQ